MEARAWFKRGIHGARTWEEYQAYMEGLEMGIMNAYVAMGRTSMSVYEAGTVGNAVGEYIENELFGLGVGEND